MEGLEQEVCTILTTVMGDQEWAFGAQLRALQEVLRSDGKHELEVRARLMNHFFADCASRPAWNAAIAGSYGVLVFSLNAVPACPSPTDSIVPTTANPKAWSKTGIGME